MKLVTTFFTQPGMISDYTRLYNVFAYSARLNMPDAEVVNLKVEPQEVPRGLTASLQANHDKMMAWAKYVDTLDDDAVLIDCDMLVMRDFQEVFDTHDFDIGLTARETGRIPFNGGVVMVRNSDAAREFIKLWAEADTKLYNDRDLHWKWRAKYRGMNQASLGMLIETGTYTAKIKRFPCSIYNAVENSWHRVAEDRPYAIHCKSNMKRTLLSSDPIKKLRPTYKQVATIWRGYEQALLADR